MQHKICRQLNVREKYILKILKFQKKKSLFSRWVAQRSLMLSRSHIHWLKQYTLIILLYIIVFKLNLRVYDWLFHTRLWGILYLYVTVLFLDLWYCPSYLHNSINIFCFRKIFRQQLSCNLKVLIFKVSSTPGFDNQLSPPTPKRC